MYEHKELQRGGDCNVPLTFRKQDWRRRRSSQSPRLLSGCLPWYVIEQGEMRQAGVTPEVKDH